MLVLRIVKPEQGMVDLPVVPGQAVVFDFDLAGASFARVADDLVITFEEGRSATLTSFFIADGSGVLSPVSLTDGTRILGEDFLRLVTSGEDIMTAMTHAPEPPDSSGGVGAYRDGPGEMISGVDRLGALEGLQFQPDSAGDAVMFSQFPASALVAASEPGGADAPYVYVRAALLGANGIDKPIVVVDLLNPDGTRMKAPYPDSVEIRGNESYDVAYDSATGKLTISLKNPEDKAAPTENVEITVGDASYIVQVGSSESNNLAEVIWAPVEEGALLTEKTWAGAVDNHLKGGDDFVKGQATGVTIVTPDGYEGKELHLQLRNSSLTADGNVSGTESASVDLKLKDGSFLISNEGNIVFEVHHDNPVNMNYESPWSDEGWRGANTSGTEYTAAVVAAVASKGESAVSTVAVTGGEAIIQAGGPALNAGNAANVKTVNIGAVYAAEGGTSTVKADVISIGASSDGFVSSGSATVSGVRADGAAVKETKHSEWWTEKAVSKNSEVILEAKGSVSVATAITGDTESQNHQCITYAGVAATERGHVNITAGEDVSISVTNQAKGGSLKTSGVYGIFSGVGLGGKDMPTLKDFLNGDGSFNEYAFNDYKSRIVDAYLRDKRGEYNQESGKCEPKGHQTSVTVESEGDVNVSVDLGTGNHTGNAAGVKAAIGDVDVTAKGDINVTVSHEGTAEGDLSALAIDHAIVNLRAEGDVNLKVHGNGTGVSVVDFHPFSKYPHGKGFSPSHLSGKRVVLQGEAGFGGGENNSITGFDATGANFQKGAFTIHADKGVLIDVAARHNGGNTSSTGIAAGWGADNYSGTGSNLTIGVDAPEFEIKAIVTGDVSEGTSTATGILAGSGSYIGIRSYESLDEFLDPSEYTKDEYKVVKPVDKLAVTAEGALQNAGIKAHHTGEKEYSRAAVDVRASELEVAVTGGASAGQENASSHGLLAKADGDGSNSAKINVETENLTVTVKDASHSVGISAQGQGAEVTIGSVRVDDGSGNTETTPLTVTIACTVTGDEALHGIAIEAIDGGQVKIISKEWEDREQNHADTVTLDGDIVAQGNNSKIIIDTDLGDDRLIVNGDIRLGKNCDFTINMGGGNDVISLGGNVSFENGGSMTVEAGKGNDLIHLNGKIELNGGSLTITGGEDDDLLVLQAPDLTRFNEWYKAWLGSEGVLESLECEAIVVSGVDDLTDLGWLVKLAERQGISLTTVNAEDAAKITDLTDYWGLAGLDGADILDTLDAVGGMDRLFASSGMPEGSGRAVGGETEYSIPVASTASGNEAEDLLFIQLATSHN